MAMSTAAASYHHGNLPNALVRAAVELLQEGGASELSLRAVVRRAGVSTAVWPSCISTANSTLRRPKLWWQR